MDGPVFQLLMYMYTHTCTSSGNKRLLSPLWRLWGKRGRFCHFLPSKCSWILVFSLHHTCSITVRWLLVGRDILTLFNNCQDHFPEVMTTFWLIMPGKVAVAPLTCWGMCTGKHRKLFHLFLCLPVFVTSMSHDWKQLTSQSGSILRGVCKLCWCRCAGLAVQFVSEGVKVACKQVMPCRLRIQKLCGSVRTSYTTSRGRNVHQFWQRHTVVENHYRCPGLLIVAVEVCLALFFRWFFAWEINMLQSWFVYHAPSI